MPIRLDFANLVLTKTLVEKHYKGGVNQFKADFDFDNVESFEEDNELLSLAQMDYNDIPVTDIIEHGIPKEQFDEDNATRETVFCSKYGGAASKPDCFEVNALFIWHKACKQESIAKAKYYGESTMNEIAEMFEEGINPFLSFR